MNNEYEKRIQQGKIAISSLEKEIREVERRIEERNSLNSRLEAQIRDRRNDSISFIEQNNIKAEEVRNSWIKSHKQSRQQEIAEILWYCY